MAAAPVAYTIGYEGWGLDDFVAHLREQRVEVLIDIREKPASRKPGFSKTPLREALEEAGIEYVHVKALGSPSTIRYEYKNGGDKETFFKAYRVYLKPSSPTSVLSWKLSGRKPAASCALSVTPGSAIAALSATCSKS